METIEDQGFFERLNTMKAAVQSDRLSRVLMSDYIAVDERNYSELILRMARYADNLKFYGASNRASGTWYKLFNQNEILNIALASCYRGDEQKKLYLTERVKSVKHDLGFSLQAFAWIDEWLESGGAFKHDVSRKLIFDARKIVRTKLVDSVSELLVLAEHYQLKKVGDQFHTKDLFAAAESLNYADVVRRYPTRVAHDKRLRKIFEAIQRLRIHIAHEAGKVFNILLQSPQHDPSVSMLLAFIKVYQQSQTQLNTFPAKLLDLYYSQILQNLPEHGSREIIYLQCRKAKGSTSVVIPKGTRISAGKTPDMRDLGYVVTGNNIINGASLTGLQTVFLDRNDKISPANATGAVTAIKHTDILALPDYHGDDAFHSLFGKVGSVATSNRGLDAELGLCVGAEVLRLHGGKRRITLNLETTDQIEELFFRLRYQEQGADEALACLPDCPNLSDIHRLSVLKGVYFHLARSLFVSLGSKMNSLGGVVDIVIDFCAALDETIISAWKDGDRAASDGLVKSLLIEIYLQTENAELLGRVHREILIRRLLFFSYVNDIELKKLLNRADGLTECVNFSDIVVQDLLHDLRKSPQSLLVYYLADAFCIKLTTSEGWLTTKFYHLSPLKGRRGLSLSFILDESQPAVIDIEPARHGQSLAKNVPVVMIALNSMSKVFAYSYLRLVMIKALNIKVSVDGFRDIALFNDYGKIDTSGSFLPFSATPSSQSALYIGGYEYARKSLDSLRIHIRWKNLPKIYGGFKEYYRAYGKGLANEDFRAELSCVVNGYNIPCVTSGNLPLLFNFSRNTGVLNDESSLEISTSRRMPKLSQSVTRSDYESFAHLKNGYICLAVKCSAQLFGHAIFPRLISETLIYNNRQRKQRALPREPYTPEIQQLTVDYCASESISLVSQNGGLNDGAAKSLLYYKVPLGSEAASHNSSPPATKLFPDWDHDGNLYIAYQCPEKSQGLAVYFELRENASHSGAVHRKTMEWCYYSRRGWQPLKPHQILADSTMCLRRSGIVNIELPSDSVEHPGLLPVQQRWLRVSTSEQLAAYASLKKIHFDAITVRSVDHRLKLGSFVSCTSGAGIGQRWSAVDSLPGIQSFIQHQAAISNTADENHTEAKVRMFERLRHKNRALAPWDYERLILERFPQVATAKCLPACRMGRASPSPGHVLIIATPVLHNTQDIKAQGHHLSSVMLSEISVYLSHLAPKHVQIEVENPRYEIIQVRCEVEFNDPIISGELAKQLDRDLSLYISPWSKHSAGHGLGWRIRIADVESYIRKRPYVQYVTKTSLVKVFEARRDSQYFCLQDTAAKLQSRASTRSSESNSKALKESANMGCSSAPSLQAQYPWTLPLPSDNHEITISSGLQYETEPSPVGIKTLEIGNTFIIQGGGCRG